MDIAVEYIARILAVIIVLTLHEFAHAFVAYKCGDPTAKWNGRMTLNPIKHFDPLGLIMFVFVGFGWAKPVPVNPYNFKDYKKGSFWTSAAGVLTNYICAFLFCPIMLLISKWVSGVAELTYGHLFIYSFIFYLYLYSLGLCVFNLLPVYPLDGFRMIEAIDKKKGKAYQFLKKYGYYILLALLLLGMLSDRLHAPVNFDILGIVLNKLRYWFGAPISWFWHLFIK